MKTIICLNGPPKSGKDGECTISSILFQCGFELYKFSDPIRKSVCSLLNIEYSEFDKSKSKILSIKNNYTIRDLTIDICEEIIKKKINKYWFAKNLIKRLNPKSNKIVISDLGFDVELKQVIKFAKKHNYRVLVWQIYRPGYTFENDSRNYINNSAVETIKIKNNGTLKDLKVKVNKKLNKLKII